MHLPTVLRRPWWRRPPAASGPRPAVYGLEDVVDDEPRALVHRGALILLREKLIEIDVDLVGDWPAELAAEVEQLHQLGRAQGRWPGTSWRSLWRSAVTLDPTDDDQFALAVALSPAALCVDGFDRNGHSAFNAVDQGDLYFDLLPDEYEALTARLSELGLPAGALAPSRRRGSA